MSKKSQIAMALEMLEVAESSLRSVRGILHNSVTGKNDVNVELTEGLNTFASAEGQIVEGIFNGEKMVGGDGKLYPVPANYASKSKLVEGDLLKLLITQTGKLLYKQIGPVERKTITGTIIDDKDHYMILAEAKMFNILLASITYYKGEVGNRVSVVIPAEGDPKWCTLEAILPSADEISDLPDELVE